MDVKPGEIELHIDEVLLVGADPSSRHAVAEALHAQLTQLFTQQPPTLTESASVAQVNAGAIGLPMQSGPQALGAAIATSVHGGLAK